MAYCMSASCRKEIDDSYAFCPYCGTDNREPHERAPVVCSRHLAVPGGRACVLCGKRLNSDGTAKRGPMYRIAGAFMIALGLLLIVGAVWMEVSCRRTPYHSGYYYGRSWGEYAVFLAGAYLVGHGWYWVRGEQTDFSLMDEIDPF